MLLAVKLPTLGLIGNLGGIAFVTLYLIHQGFRDNLSRILKINLNKLIWMVPAGALIFVFLFLAWRFDASGNSRVKPRTGKAPSSRRTAKSSPSALPRYP
jgi:hypothetical protein